MTTKRKKSKERLIPKVNPRDKTKPRHDHPPLAKHTPVELDGVLDRVAFLDRMGYRQIDIAKEVGVTQPMVSNYLKTISQRYQESALINRHELIQRELAVLLDTRKMAIEGLNKSKEGKKKWHQESMSGGEGGGYEKEGQSEEGLLPPSEYMNVILKTNERICDMFGLDEAVKNIFNVTATNNTVVATPQDIVSMILGLRKQSDPVEDEMKKLEDMEPVKIKD